MLHKGETRTNSNTYSLHVLKSLKQPKSNRQHIISCDVVSVYITRQAMDWNIITSAAEALNGTIIFLCSWDGASDLKCLMGSRAYSEWLTLPLNCSALDRCQAAIAILCNIQWLHGHRSCREHRWVNDCCTVGGRAEIIHKHTLMPKHTQLTVQLLPCGWETATSHDCQLLSGPVFIINTSVTEWETERTHDDGDDGGDSLWFTASLLLESKVHLIQ